MKQLIWDLPTRLFHWSFAGSVFAAYALANLAPEESALFYSHILFAVLAALLLVWRLIWGLIGSSHARFRALLFSPAEVAAYLRSIVSGHGRYYAGHNPGGALAIWAIFALSLITIASGLAMSSFGEAAEEVHEIAPNLLMAVVAAHVIGVILATLMHKENYVKAMFTGQKKGSEGDAIGSSRPLAAFLMVLFIATGFSYFFAGFDTAQAQFKAPGTNFTLQLGEEEHEENEGAGWEHEDDEDHDEEDDDDDDD